MLAEIVPIDGNIELVQNSGIQFVDYDVFIDWKSKDNHSLFKTIENGYFMRMAANKDEPLIRLVPKVSAELSYVDPLNNRVVDCDAASYTVPTKQSLDLYDGVWFPLPFLPEHGMQGQAGPLNWVRARVVKVNDPIAILKAAKVAKQNGSLSEEAYANLLKQINEQQAKAQAQTQANAQSFVNLGTANPDTLSASNPNASVNINSSISSSTSSSTSSLTNSVANSFASAKELVSYYRVILAFDTKTQAYSDNFGYFAPSERDVESGIRFKLAYTADKSHFFLKSVDHGLPWVREWAEAVFRDLYKERVKPRMLDEDVQALLVQDHEHEAHYLNMLAFIGFMVQPKAVHFISNHLKSSGRTNAKTVDVSLILDIGNSRSCGIMVEDHPNVTREDDDFSNTYVLTLRDLNAPEHTYSDPFTSRIEFARPDFDYDNRSARSGRPDAFSWPSMVRVGTEASNLSAHREGNEGSSGLTSPKRYIWNDEPLTNDRWVFNNYSYLIKSKKLQTQEKENVQRAFLNSIGCYFNTEGKAYFALNPDETVFDNLESCYSNRSTMTFMLIEIILHAMVQMNSLAQRQHCTSKDAPRRLRAIILTTPPGMAAEEKELYRACVYEALGILWKSLGFDTSSPREFNFATQGLYSKATFSETSSIDSTNSSHSSTTGEIIVPVPDVYMDWNEAEAGQVVYIYNESQKTFLGNCKAFIQSLRRLNVKERIAESLVDKDGHALISTRIASLDIGGGTTDLVIKDYSFKKDVPHYSADIVPHEVLRDGFKIAGDDILHDIIKECLMTRLAVTLARHKVNPKPVLKQLVGEGSSGNVRNDMLRSQFTQQILVKIAYKILFHLEHLDLSSNSCIVQGTIRDFICDREVNSSLPVTVKRMGAYAMPSNEVLAFVDGVMGQYLKGFNILDYKIKIDITKISEAIIAGQRFDICRILQKLGEVIYTFDCDLLLLTGRASKLPCIKAFFTQRLNLPATRILAMHEYRCESWYPFKRDGEFIGDPKTTASVGALLSYLRLSHDKFPNFRFYSYPEVAKNNAHYVGIIDNSNMISEDAVLYKYESSRMLAKMNQTNEEDEESNFVPYKRTDEHFTTQLSVELGCRLLDDPQFEALPLYKIEAYNHVDEIAPIRKALALTYNSLEKSDVMDLVDHFDFEIAELYRAKVLDLFDKLDNLEFNEQAYKDTLLQQLESKIRAEVSANFVEPSGLKGLFANKQKLEQDKENEISSKIQQAYNVEVLERFKQYLVTKRYELEEQLTDLINQALADNIACLRQRFGRGFEQLLHKLNVERCRFDITLKKVNKHSPYPLPFVKKCRPELKMVESFQLESVIGEDGRDYTPYFKMYLKTISGAKVKYFMDSGIIDLNGLNPRFVL